MSLSSFYQLSKTHQFKLYHLFRKNYLALALWYTGRFEELGFACQQDALQWLANKIGSRCMYNEKATYTMLKASPLASQLEDVYLKAVIRQAKPLRLSERAQHVVMVLATEARGVRLGDIARKTQMARDNLYHLLVTLEKTGIVRKLEGRYRLIHTKQCLYVLKDILVNSYLINYYYYLAITIINTKISTTPERLDTSPLPKTSHKTPKKPLEPLVPVQFQQSVREFGLFKGTYVTHFTVMPPVNPFEAWPTDLLELLDARIIPIDPVGIRRFQYSVSLEEENAMYQIVGTLDVPGKKEFSQTQIDIGYFHEPVYKIGSFLNDRFQTQFSDEPTEYYRLRCPFHTGDSQSFYVWYDGHYHCYHGGCGVSGYNLPHLVCKLDGCELEDALDKLDPYEYPQSPDDRPLDNGSYGPPQIEGVLQDKKAHHAIELRSTQDMVNGVYVAQELRPNWLETSPTANYLFTRGFLPETLAHFHVHDFYKLDTRYPVFVPLLQNGEVYGSMRRAIFSDVKPKYLTSAGTPKQQFFYGEIPSGSTPILVEGVTDAWTVYQSGYTSFGALLGCSLSKAHIQRLLDWNIQRVLVATDMDSAGTEAFYTIYKQLAHYNIQATRFVYMAKDIAMLSPAAFHDALNISLHIANLNC